MTFKNDCSLKDESPDESDGVVEGVFNAQGVSGMLLKVFFLPFLQKNTKNPMILPMRQLPIQNVCSIQQDTFITSFLNIFSKQMSLIKDRIKQVTAKTLFPKTGEI